MSRYPWACGEADGDEGYIVLEGKFHDYKYLRHEYTKAANRVTDTVCNEVCARNLKACTKPDNYQVL